MFRTDPRRAAACFRLSPLPTLPADALAQVLAPDNTTADPVGGPDFPRIQATGAALRARAK
jgi:hypothetical protein